MIRIFLTIVIIFPITLMGALAQVASSVSDDDIIKELKQESKKEEEALKVDLESLGLDQLPDDKKDAKKSIAKDVKKTIPTTTVSPSSSTNIKPQTETPIEENKKDKTKKPSPKTDPRLVGINTTDVKTEDPKPESQISLPSEEKTKKVLPSIISKPIEKIKSLLGSEKKDSSDLKKVPTESAPKPTQSELDEKAKKELDEDKKAKEKERLEKIRQRKIASQELIQKEKAAKLELLRQKYLDDSKDNGANEGFENLTDYKPINTIIPKEKVPPKFLGTDIPPPLLNRVKGEDNKHHPVIMSFEERVELMFGAIANNKIDEFNALYATMENPNLINSSGDTLLTFAVLMQRYDAVISILSKGADPDLRNELGYTPMNIAIELMDYKSAKILSNMGAKIDYIDDAGRTYLMQAAKSGSLPIVDLLVRKGANVNESDNNGVTALAVAYRSQKEIVARYLLKYGAEIRVKKENNFSNKDTQMINDIFKKWD